MPIIYKVIYTEINHSFSNMGKYLIYVKFVSLNHNIFYQLARIILSLCMKSIKILNVG